MLKKFGLTFILNAAACVLALVAWIMVMVTNANESYPISSFGTAVALGIIAVLLIAAGTFASMKFGSQNFITAVIKLAAVVLIAAVIGLVLVDRSVLAAELFSYNGSDNPLGWSAFITAVVGIVFAVLAVILLIVTAFMNNKKKD